MRDRDVRIAIKEALEATDAFTGVFLSGLPEDHGYGTSTYTAAVIEPVSGKQEDRWDDTVIGDLIVTSQVSITFMARHIEPAVRDAAVEMLFDTAANALNGQALAGLTEPFMTKFANWQYQKAKDVERRITSTFTYQYLVPGWNQYDTTE